MPRPEDDDRDSWPPMQERPAPRGGSSVVISPTKTLRDEFAMAALTVSANLAQNMSGCVDSAPLARCAYAIADAMMAAREVKS